jgi:hypothetical protein
VPAAEGLVLVGSTGDRPLARSGYEHFGTATSA